MKITNTQIEDHENHENHKIPVENNENQKKKNRIPIENHKTI